MALSAYKCWILLASVLMTLDGVVAIEPCLSAAPPGSRKKAKPPVEQPLVSKRPVPTTSPKVKARNLSRTESGKSLSTKEQIQAPSDRTPLKIRRRPRAGGRFRPSTVVEPKTSFSYHGILEQPQRYNTSRDRRTARAPHPLAEELLGDHFNELDKNRDGVIDPFERILGRLHIDRDMTNRQWE